MNLTAEKSATQSASNLESIDSSPANAGASPQEISAALALARTADECVLLAGQAGAQGDSDLRQRCLNQAVATDRNCQTALLALAADSLDAGDPAETFAFLEEADRAGVLPENAAPLHRKLWEKLKADPRLEDYFRATGRVTAPPPSRKLSVVLVTNLFPPQELGGYGRMMWEFAHALAARGHALRVLTADVPEFAKVPTGDEQAMEARVQRRLQMLGKWVGGRPAPLTDGGEIARRLAANAETVRTAIAETGANLVLAGNLDFLGVDLLQPALQGGVPVLHALANAAPGYTPAEQPRAPHYWVAPCSDWNGQALRQAGYAPGRCETLYPGARLDRFFRLFLPDVSRLRICYASLVLPYKGVDTLVAALGRLHHAGIDFSAEIAGDAPDDKFRSDLEARALALGLKDKVHFTGFLDRDGLSALFARNNVLVFPSRFQEPFGISQVEAMAAGLVVVSSGTGGAKEIVRAGVDGLVFPAGNDVELAGQLASLGRNPAAMARLQRAGQARAFAFSVENAARKIEALAEQMAPVASGQGAVAASAK